MVTCPNCGHSNRSGILFCEYCAHAVDKKATHTTNIVRPKELNRSRNFITESLGDTARLSDTTPYAETLPLGDVPIPEQDFFVILYVKDATDPIIVPSSDKVILGRMDLDGDQLPDVDFTVYGALKRGVSRIHAAIERDGNGLVVVDLGSINGTYLNNRRLIQYDPTPLRDGDEIRLGMLAMYCYFNTRK